MLRKFVASFVSLFCLFVITAPKLHAQADLDWRVKVQQELPLLGHRNWIMIVDSAYPLQVSPGIETIETGMDQLAGDALCAGCGRSFDSCDAECLSR